ncbi:DUF4982 domain-containing protein [Alkalicoccobacillus plakortidis]|uniref:DUF4982 domain-containing protein n=1 Tax=Alkalicoccobacillus plakortidis TaxID=444060 RepID=A0ABT0XNZ8_9BACI|nr:DUF4982 domain-containing protein [Alkalicoccobacillus plakortidis]MCM2677445.1 DUF4982 domain-containing protein [Alkalicoccobacillus plakortidis]
MGKSNAPIHGSITPELYEESIYFKPWGWEPVERSYTFSSYENQKTRVDIYSDAEEVELFINGRSYGKKEAGWDHKYKTSFDIVYEPGTLQVVAYESGEEVGRDQLETAHDPISLKLETDRDEISSNYGDLSYIKMTILDSSGREIPYADHLITLQVEGQGELIAVGSADPLSTELFVENQRRLYKGKSLAIVRSTGKEGTFTVTATAEGIESQSVTVTCKETEKKYKEFIIEEKLTIYGFDMTVGELVENPVTKEIIQKHLPEFLSNPLLERAKRISFNQLIQFTPETILPKDKLKLIEAELKNVQ